MKQSNKIFYIIFLQTLLTLITLQYKSYGQNILVLHRLDGNKDIALQIGRRVKVKTIDGFKIKGKITQIKDNSIVISKGEESIKLSTEVPINKIRYIYFRNTNGWGIAGGEFLSALVFYLVIPPIISTYYLTIHKYSHDVLHKYELIVVKTKINSRS